ncbi:MAG: SagB family peptide dehydrogenase [Actinobacteria bacterium]|nr:SagB family peptide dehydrogenase [Actinomycetota bacterium]
MSGDLARSYHDRTTHTWRSVRSSGHQLDWTNQPLPFKLYPDLPALPLPVDLGETDWPAIDALSGEPPPNRRAFDRSRLAALLFYTAGVTRRWGRGDRELNFRAASSAGALYPIETYVVVRDLGEGLPAGVYHFEPIEFALRRLREGDHRADLAAAAADGGVAHAPVTVVFTGIPWRSMWKYRLRGYRHLFWDAGAMLANVLAVTTGMGEPARVLTGFVDARVTHLLGLDEDEEVPLALVPVGVGDAQPARAIPPPDDLPHRTVPVAPRRTHVPEVFATHRVGDLPDGGAVERWRATMQDLRMEPATPRRPPPLVAAYDTVEEVILRRGATRRYARARVPAPALTWPLSVLAQDIAADFVLPGDSLLAHHVIVHAVEHVPSGAYRWLPDGLDLERPGSFRGEATQLCLEQPLGGESAYTILHTADLQRILDKGGERAYRAVQLEGGIALGRAQLAAFTLGLGATGLTFYDEDVTRFLGAPAEPVCVTSVGVPAYRSRRGRRPSDSPAPPLLR